MEPIHGPRYGDYRDPLPEELHDHNAYWERMERHEREHGIRPATTQWPSPGSVEPYKNVRRWWKLLWMVLTSPIFLALVPIAALVSLFDHRDVFPAAQQWTHGILPGHRWSPNGYEWRMTKGAARGENLFICHFCEARKRVLVEKRAPWTR